MFLLSEATLPMEGIRVATALAGVAIGTYYDLFNKKNVPEMFLYIFLAIAFILNVVAYDSTISFYAIGTAVLVFAAFYLLYKTGQLGGADAYIMTALALLLPIQPKGLLLIAQPSFLSLPFILDIILASGISFMLYMLVRSIPVAFGSLKLPGKLERKSIFGAFAIVLAFGIFSVFAAKSGFVSINYFLFLSFMVLLCAYFTIFKNAINDSMLVWVEGNKVEAEDILAIDKMDSQIVKEYSLSRLVDEKMLARLKGIKQKKVALYAHLPPFIPHILIGLLVSLFFGNIVLLFSGGF